MPPAANFGTLFQSTLLMRGATSTHSRLCHQQSDFNPRSSCEERRAYENTHKFSRRDFNPRSSCEERPEDPAAGAPIPDISIHAPHARSDGTASTPNDALTYFNPRSSCEERLSRGSTCHGEATNFNPRSSCEERLQLETRLGTNDQFQSTLLMRGATKDNDAVKAANAFQSTLLMRGATQFIPQG